MALSNVGQAPCPYCTQPAQVGIAKDGKGNAVHLLRRPCGINLQAHRHSVVGRRLEEEAYWGQPAYEGADMPGVGGSMVKAEDSSSDPWDD